jgi:branched-chain amino acid transport system ATP-binding protein
MLQVHNVEVVYDDAILALRGASCEVAPGTIVALLGANGAGKTTVLRAVSGLLGVHRGRITRGSVMLDGRRIDGLSAPRIVKRGIAQVLEGRRIFSELSVDENLRVGAHSVPRGRRIPLARAYESAPVLGERRRRTAGYLSGGELQMLAIWRALMARPRYLLMDEPSLGLAPRLVRRIRDLIAEIARDGTAVLLVEQNAHMALEIADHAYVLENGRNALDGRAAVLRENDEVRDLYLGLSHEGEAVSGARAERRPAAGWLS